MRSLTPAHGFSLAGATTFTWFGTPPNEPGSPFGNPELVVYDSLRVVCFVAGAIGVALAAALILRERATVGQRVRLLAGDVGGITYVVMTEAYRFGDYANLRLILALLVTMGAAWGNYLGVRYELPPAPYWHHWHPRTRPN